MKPKHGGDDPLKKLTPGERKALRRRQGIIEQLDELQRKVLAAPPELEMSRESIWWLLMAAYHLLDVKPGLLIPETDYEAAESLRTAIGDVNKALGPLGLGVEYWDKLNAWRLRDLKERGDTDFLVMD